MFRRPICAGVDTATAVTKAVIALHNFLMKNRNFQESSRYCSREFIDTEVNGCVKEGQWRNEQFNNALVKIKALVPTTFLY